MKRYLLPLIGLLAGGCAVAPPRQPSLALATPRYSEAAAAALAFDPPISDGAEHPELARAPRANSAFFGYQESTVETYLSAGDDIQTNQWGDFYTNESVNVKSGVNYR